MPTLQASIEETKNDLLKMQDIIQNQPILSGELKGLQLAQLEATATIFEQGEADKLNTFEALATILENQIGGAAV